MKKIIWLFVTGLLISHLLVPLKGQTMNAPWVKKGYNVESFGHKDLAEWNAYGIGANEANHGQTVMHESAGSLGYMLVSPKSYGKNTIVSFDVLTLNAATVLVVEMAAHNSPNFDLNLEAGYDGNVKYLFENVQMYMFAFHNAAHNKKGPFVRKYPEPGTEPLAAASKNMMQVGKYHHVEMGIEEGELWFKIDGKRVWKTRDQEYHKGGKVILRIRGTAHETASCIIKNLNIYHKDA
jgi:hypothetical protein